MLFRNADLADGRTRDVRVAGERVAAVAEDLEADGDERVIDATDKLLLPGAIDAHVHFREPGFERKETWASGSRSAAAGGVTAVVDQPNTDPPTVTGAAFDEKAALARDSLVDWGINGGVTPDWDPDSLFDRPLFALGEVFLADSTGEMGIDADRFADALARATDAGVAVTVHAEDADLFDGSALPSGEADGPTGERADADAWSAYRTAEAEAAAVERAVEAWADVTADATAGDDAGAGAGGGVGLHVAHTSTPEGIDAAAAAGATCEVTPHHLLLSRDDLDGLGTFGRMNPPLRSEARREAVYERVADGAVDVIATDHAPHTRAEKDVPLREAPSGVPGVETLLPLLLVEARAGRLDYERVRDLTARNPAEIFGLPRKGRIAPGNDADLALFDLGKDREIRGEELHSACDWTPFEGRTGIFPELTAVRGTVVYEEGSFGPSVGRNLRA